MPVGPFDTIEVVTLVFNLTAFLFMHRAYTIGIATEETKKFWTYFLWIAAFVLLNRVFTNLEAVILGTALNVLEHLSTLAAGVILTVATKNLLKGGSNK